MFLTTGLSSGLIHLTLSNSNFWKDCQSLINNSKATMNYSVTYVAFGVFLAISKMVLAVFIDVATALAKYSG